MENRSLQVLWEDGERVVCRGRRRGADGKSQGVLAGCPPPSTRPPQSLIASPQHEYRLKDELDGAWAVPPLEFVREGSRTMLVFEDPGGEPLDHLLAFPLRSDAFFALPSA